MFQEGPEHAPLSMAVRNALAHRASSQDDRVAVTGLSSMIAQDARALTQWRPGGSTSPPEARRLQIP